MDPYHISISKFILNEEKIPEVTSEFLEKICPVYKLCPIHTVNTTKLKYRVLAAAIARKNLAIDMFTGDKGFMRRIYKELFDRVVTVDSNYDCEYKMTANKFIENHLLEFINFNFIDFDMSGCPALFIQQFFKKIQGKKDSFILCLTDGNGYNIKRGGSFNFDRYYLTSEGTGVRKCTSNDLDNLKYTVKYFIEKVCFINGFTAKQLSLHIESRRIAMYQTYEIIPGIKDHEPKVEGSIKVENKTPNQIKLFKV